MTKGLVKKMVKKKESSIDLSKIADHIHEGHMKMQKSKTGFIKKKSFSPSTLVFGNGHCARDWYLANMNTGSSSHERIQGALEAQGILEWQEQEIINEDPPIFGYADAMVKLEDKLVLLEIKTTKNEAFEYHKAKGTASTYHIEQLLIYMKILKQQVGAIVYENKNTHEICVIPVVAN